MLAEYVPTLAVCLSILAAAAPQARPDFSGRWTRIPTSQDEKFTETVVVTHTADTLTLSDPQSGAVVRAYKLDGSENKTTQGKNVEVFRSAWEGRTLVFRGSGSNADGPYALRAEYSIDGNRLTVHVTQTNERTGALLREQKLVYSK
jgi:hypothetical protein